MLTVAALALLQAAPAKANVPFQTITGTFPIRQIYLGNDLSCQVQLSVDADLDFYPPTVAPGDCGTFLQTGGVTSRA